MLQVEQRNAPENVVCWPKPPVWTRWLLNMGLWSGETGKPHLSGFAALALPALDLLK